MITSEDLDAMGYSDYVKVRHHMRVPDMVEEFAITMGQDKNPLMSRDLIDEEYKEWAVASCVQGNDQEELKELSDLVYVIYGYARARGWDLEEALSRVHKNNMTRCIWPDGSVKRREDGKVLKNPSAPKIDLGDMV